MIKVLYKASNPYTCQGVRLTPGKNEVDEKKFEAFITHPGVVSRIKLNIIEVLDDDAKVKEKLEVDSEKPKVELQVSTEEPQVSLEDNQKEDTSNAEQLVIDKHPVKQIVAKVKQTNCVSMLMKVIGLTDSVRVKKAAEERVEELVKNK